MTQMLISTKKRMDINFCDVQPVFFICWRDVLCVKTNIKVARRIFVVGKSIEYLNLLVYSGCRYTFVFEHLDSLPGQFWYCDIWIMLSWTSSLCSTLFILNMTFERFYSIIRPHKAASFNTVKRAKLTILCIVSVSILFNLPHLFVTLKLGESCIPFGKAQHVFGESLLLALTDSEFLSSFRTFIDNEQCNNQNLKKTADYSSKVPRSRWKWRSNF